LNNQINGAFDGFNLDTFVQHFYKKKVSELSPTEKTKAETEYKNYKDSSDSLEFLKLRLAVLEGLESQFSPKIKQYIESGYYKTRQDVLDNFLNLQALADLSKKLSEVIPIQDLVLLTSSINGTEEELKEINKLKDKIL
jgi:hypothetical protein